MISDGHTNVKSIGQKNTTAYLPLMCLAKLKSSTISPEPNTAADVKSGALRVTKVIMVLLTN